MPRRVCLFFFFKSFKLKTLHKDFSFKCILDTCRKVFGNFWKCLRIRVGAGGGAGRGRGKAKIVLGN